ncbi:MAG: PAS domain S-box protein [Chitinophagales bacterium]|nr:PAS domain S-box protein [Chitinophagales bacterium]
MKQRSKTNSGIVIATFKTLAGKPKAFKPVAAKGTQKKHPLQGNVKAQYIKKLERELDAAKKEKKIACTELNAAHRALEKQEVMARKSEINTQALLNNSMQSFILIDESYKIIAFNRIASKTFKDISSISLLEGGDFKTLLSRKEFAGFAIDFKQALKGKSVFAQRDIIYKKGKIKTFLFNFTPVVDATKQTRRISLSMLDVTQTQIVRSELNVSQKLIESFYDTTDIGIAVIDIKGKIVKTNEGLTKLFGYKSNELNGKPWYSLIAPADLKEAKKVQAENKGGKTTDFEKNGIRKDGILLDVYVTSKPLISPDGRNYIIKTIRDITESKKNRELLLQAERLTKIGGFEIAPEGKSVTWTDEMYRIFEVEKDFIPSLNRISKFCNSNERTELNRKLENALANGKALDKMCQIITSKGNLKWVHMLCTPVLVKPKLYKLLGTIQDITAQKLIEQEIERLSWVASHTNNPVVITDNQGRIEWVNHSFEKLMGYKLKDITGKQPDDLLKGKNTDKEILKRISKRLKKRLPSTGEVLLNYTRQGEPIWISSDVSPIFKENKHIGFVGIMTDLTDIIAARELREEQKTILEKQKLFDVISKYFPNGIIGILNPALKYIFVGGKELNNLGLNHTDLIGDGLFDKMHTQATETATPFLQQAFLNQTVSFQLTIKGSIYEVIAVPINHHSGPVTQILVVIQNITQSKKNEEALQNALNRQKELSDMKSKFVSIASHEFRTPLSTILSSTFLVGKYNQPEDAEKREKHLQRIKNSVTSLTDILNDFLSVGKIEEGVVKNKPMLFNISTFFSDFKDEMQSHLKQGQKIILNHKGAGEMVYLDPQHLKNISINLLSNAIKYSAENKPIYIESTLDEDYLKVSVKDKGIGIPVEDQKNLFQTFFRANNVSNIQGTGMGLSIVKRYLDIMGGNITFSSKPSSGSCFTIEFTQAPLKTTD